MEDQAPRYAVLFKIFFWDSFVERRLRAVAKQAPHGDVWVVIDESRGSLGPIPHPLVWRITDRQMIETGYANYPPGNMFWYNADYPLLEFAVGPGKDYDYLLMVEYDVAANTDFDQLIRWAQARSADFVAEQIEVPLANWRWRETLADAYDESEVVPSLICVALCSRRAAEGLRTARLELSARYNSGAIKRWPIAEGYMATEANRQNMIIRHWSETGGQLTRYDVWPPYHEALVPAFHKEMFVHPVLRGRRFLSGFFRNGTMPALRALLSMLIGRNPSRYAWSRAMGWTARRGWTKPGEQLAPPRARANHRRRLAQPQ